MSVSVGGKIVTDGLIIHYDALNGKSYPGSGTDWYNLGPKANYSGSLLGIVNPPTIANGYASFVEGDDSYVNILDITEINDATPKVTVDMWVRINPIPSGDFKYLLGWYTFYIIVRNDNPYNIGTGGNLQDSYGADNLDSLGVIGNWAHYSIVMVDSSTDGSPHAGLPLSDNKIYINSQNQSLSQIKGSSYLDKRVFSSGATSNARIGGRWLGPAVYSGGFDIALMKIYNRELTQAEVTQNYNAHKGRFNIY